MKEASLVALGYRFRTQHWRFYAPVTNRVRVRTAVMPAQFHKTSKRKPFPRGGMTRVEIIGPNGEMFAEGFAYCSPKDNYDRKVGHQMATDQAILHAFTRLTAERRETNAETADTGRDR